MYIGGIDGGGSKTECIIWDDNNKEVVARSKTGPANHQVVGLEQAADEIKKSLKLALADVGLQSIPLVGLGVAGAGRKNDISQLETKLNNIAWLNECYITDDGRTALLGATGGKPGMILVAGTGSIAYGLRKDRDFIRSGGWGPILGDEGSGFWLGLKALKFAIKAEEGRAQKTSLTNIVKKQLEIKSLTQLIPFIHQKEIPRKKIAALAPYIINEAKKRDDNAIRIVEGGVEELLLLIQSIKTKLDYSPQELSVTGGLFENDYFKQLFNKRLNEKFNLNTYKPRYSAEYGAVLYAQKQSFSDIEK